MSAGMYAPLSNAFINLTASRCYKIYNFLGSDAKGHFWDLLHEGAADELGWHSSSLDDFEDAEVCEFAASVGMFTHKQYKKRLSKGQSLRMDNISRTLRKAKQRKRMRSFFGRFVPVGKKK